MKRYIFAIVLLLGAVSCEKDPKASDHRAPYNVTVDEISGITETSAVVRYSYSLFSTYVYIEEEILLYDSSGNYITSYSAWGGECRIDGLEAGKTYSVRVHLKPFSGNGIASEAVSFATPKPKKVELSVPTALLTQTEYSSSGFVIDGERFNYPYAYYITYTWNLTGHELCESTAVYFDDGDWYGFKNLTRDGSYSRDMIHFSKSSSFKVTFCSYAILKDGREMKSPYTTRTFYYSSNYATNESNHDETDIESTDCVCVPASYSPDHCSFVREATSEER